MLSRQKWQLYYTSTLKPHTPLSQNSAAILQEDQVLDGEEIGGSLESVSELWERNIPSCERIEIA